MPKEFRPMQKTRAERCKHQIMFFSEYLRAMERVFEAKIQKSFEKREKIKEEIAGKTAHLETMRPGIVGNDVYDTYVSEIPSDLDDLRYELSNIEELDLPLMDAFVNILRKSFFVSLYSFLESQLVDECRIRKQARSDIRLSLGEISGKGIFRAKIYLDKVLEIGFSFDTPEWKEIQGYNLLRNCIVHSDGRIDDFYQEGKLREYINRNKPMLSIVSKEQDCVALSNGFCDKSVNTISKFLTELIGASERR